MMKLLVFLMTFSLEVHVYAQSQQEPKNCLQTKGVCAVGNDDERGFSFKVGDATVTLDKDSAVIRKSAHEIRLVKGNAWIDGELTVSSEFGQAKGENFWVSKTTHEFTASAIDKEVELEPRGSKETLTVEAGLQNTLGQIGFNGQAATGLPMPIPFKDFVLRWGRVFKGPKQEFESKVADFHAKWEEATVTSAAINKAVFDRKIASVEEAARLEAEKRAKVEAEKRELRQMFRKRNGL